MKAAQRMGWPEVTPVPFLSADPIAHLVGHSNEAPVIVAWQIILKYSIQHQICSQCSLKTLQIMCHPRSSIEKCPDYPFF